MTTVLAAIDPRARTTALGLTAPVLEYPTERHISAVIEAQRILADECPPAATELGCFLAWLAGCRPGEAEEVYTRTFVLAPVCAPYASVHIFGEESFRRAELMSALREAFDRLGIETASELPDHLSLLLRLAGGLDEVEREELAAYCLRPAVAAMSRRLAETRNPYRHALRALELLLDDGGGALEER